MKTAKKDQRTNVKFIRFCPDCKRQLPEDQSRRWKRCRPCAKTVHKQQVRLNNARWQKSEKGRALHNARAVEHYQRNKVEINRKRREQRALRKAKEE